ncbi:MAG: AraC family transcriptional regulator [Cellulosilyticaceae bacterium]
MNWIVLIGSALEFIEEELGNPKLSSQLVAKQIHVSESHFIRAFHILTGFTLSEYIRNRRLCIAGDQLQMEGIPIGEVALNVGYESPEAFSKAFKRFHGVNPSESRNVPLKAFYPMEVKLILTQECPLKYSIEEKAEIYLSGTTQVVPSDDDRATAYLWARCEANGYLDECCQFAHFETLVGVSTEEGYTIKAKCRRQSQDTAIILPASKWAVFACEGDYPDSILKTWNQIYGSWIPKTDYTLAEIPQLEVYFETEEDYSCEIWLPIKN